MSNINSMFPLQQAHEVRDAVIEFLKATFPFKEKNVGDAFYRFIEDRQNGLFKGPYISLKTPFVSATEEEMKDIPLDIIPKFPPYKHQLQAFRQLTSKNHKPEPTLLTTGTGSGKTECFLYPVLDYCYSCHLNGRRQGVKAIILYPMNALATDQAKRLANRIWNDDRLKGKVTAGLFVGEGVNPEEYPRDMGMDHIIENRAAIVDSVPDIILTNFKMLDYGLMRQEFMPLWKGNFGTDNKALRYIVLDELHTYDGAQGTDVANLIRRLKLKLDLPKHTLCPVGTSATIGNGEDSKARLCEYASNVFGEKFEEKNVIEEHRIPIDEYIKVENNSIPDGRAIRDCVFKSDDDVDEYRGRICKVWLGNKNATQVEVAEALKKMAITKDLLVALGDGSITQEELQRKLEITNDSFRLLRQKFSETTSLILIENLLALISYAKRPLSEKSTAPFLYLQVQLWQRELSGILRYVQSEPEFAWRGSIKEDEERISLPIWFCRDCGASGWISRKLLTDNKYSSDVGVINKAFMNGDRETVLLNIAYSKHTPIDEYLSGNSFNRQQYVKLSNLTIVERNEGDTIRLQVCQKTTNNQKFSRTCPECAQDSISQIGSRVSTLSSVAIFQVLSSDFDSSEEDKRKMLVFTNSVQDAAHHAGFYEARTFRFLFRQSMQKYINTLSEPVNMVDLQNGFKEFWHNELEDEKYYNRFLPSDISSRIDLHQDYRDNNGFTQAFKDEFELRVDWEILSEFGLTSRLGRTLEKTGTSATFFKKDVLLEVYAKMEEWMRENNMGDIADNEDGFCHFVYGILQRMRSRGAIDHPFLEKFRNEALNKYALNWYKDSRHFLNRELTPWVGFPKPVGTTYYRNSGNMLDIAIARNENRPTWYNSYFKLNFNCSGVANNILLFNEFIQMLFEKMAEVGLVNKGNQGGGNYAICPEQIWISKDVKHIKCDTCESCLCVAKEDELAEGTKCLNFRCKGEYSIEQSLKQNYYQQVYNRKVSPRVYAHEHTGLLERAEREEIEKDFKTHPHPDSINVLSATSTLEMGIDIGDLNIMGNTDVPPKPSNFLQRVGRVGRKEGSALVLNYAHAGEPHDMYYYTYPDEMMHGEINTPGCFLEARDILRRQFFAYCIDSWTSANPKNTLPRRINNLNLLERDIFTDETFIINRIFGFIRDNKDSLISAFRSQYEETSQEAIEKLILKLDDGTFFNDILKVFDILKRRLIDLREKLNQLQEQKKHIQESDPKIIEIQNLIKATNRQRILISAQNLIEFMTNAGLLPNYAFPETGIKLSASIYPSQAKSSNSKNLKKPTIIELTRPASQGIRELAPGNNFYTHKFKLEVTGLSTYDWNEGLRKMRYCSKCDCIALEGEEEYDMASCPKCNDASWGANQHAILKHESSRSLMKSDEAILDDSKEEREKENYIVKRHFIFRHTGTTTSYAIRNVGFGIEFCNNLDLYEVNYGMQKYTGGKILVNGENVPDHGFITCRYCGKSTHRFAGTPIAEQHYRFCSHGDKNFLDDQNHDVFETLYLYRHLQTEAIKILLPIHMGDVMMSAEMFKAGIELGMKAYYKSSPEHIRIDTYSEMNPRVGKKDQYLIMYDIVPGGTGYLSKLFNTTEFSKMLTLAYNKIHDCTCQWEGKNACYHCILTYGNQYKRDDFSRERADEIFGNLISNINSWEMIPGSISSISESGVAEDSELELKFVKTLKSLAEKEKWEFEKVSDVDSYRYELHIINPEEDTDIKYFVIPQYVLGEPLGVKHYTIADFLIVCMSATIKGEVIEHLETLPIWAIYLDGYAFHAQEPNMRFYGDKEKRDGIKDSKIRKMFSWTMTWGDIELFEQDKEDALCLNSVARLSKFLSDPRPINILEIAYGCILYYTKNVGDFLHSGGELYNGEIQIDEDIYDEFTNETTDEQVVNALLDSVHYNWHLNNLSQSIDKDEWVEFWRKYNILQFFVDDMTYFEPDKPIEKKEINRDEVKLYYPGLEQIVDILIDNNIEFGYEGEVELTNEDGMVIATAGMLLKDRKIAIDPDDGSKSVFEEQGYRIIDSNNFDINDVIS